MIEFSNINFRYAGGTEAGGLVNINLIIPDGQVILLCGQSGCGKTTLTRLVNGLIPNYYEGKLSGEVLLDGKNISSLPLYETAKYVGSVFQNPRTQFFTVDSTSELAFGCENQGLPKEEIIQRVKSTAKQFDMDNLLGKNIFSLSGGEKQKIACASVSASNPSIIKNADQIIVLQNGQVENTGTHQQLLVGDALYRDMWEAHIGAQNWSAGSGKGGN